MINIHQVIILYFWFLALIQSSMLFVYLRLPGVQAGKIVLLKK